MLDGVHLLLEIATHKAQYRLFTSALFMDVMGALDKVRYIRLAAMMTEAGFHPHLVHWVQNYLSKHTMRITDEASAQPTFAEVGVGIPQGSLISSFLFNVYSSQLFHYEAKHETDLKMMYVNNFALVASGTSWRLNSTLLSNAGNELQTEVGKGGMYFDISKTKLFHFPCKNSQPNQATASNTLVLHTIGNSEQPGWVRVWLSSSLRPLIHISKRAAAASSIRLHKLMPLCKKLRPEEAL